MRLVDDYSYYHVILWNKKGYMRHYDMLYLSFEFLEEDFEFVMFLKFEFPNDILGLNVTDLIMELEQIYSVDTNTFIVLTPRKSAPLSKESPDEEVHSFSCGLEYFRSIIKSKSLPESNLNNLLFEILDQILEDPTLGRLLVRQIPIKHFSTINQVVSDVIIPHRGNNLHLNNLLMFLYQLKSINVFIGIDQLVTRDIFKMVTDYPKQSFYGFEPNPMGPYVIRNWLIEQGSSEIIFFQDSDDFSCSDRFAAMSDFMNTNSCQLCGSHEIKLDYYDRSVRAIRYPLDVKEALKWIFWQC